MFTARLVTTAVLLAVTGVGGFLVGSETRDDTPKPAVQADKSKPDALPQDTSKDETRQSPMPCPIMSGKTPGPQMGGKMMEQCQAMMKKMGGPEEMMKMCPCPMMKKMQGDKDSEPSKKPVPANKDAEGSDTKE